MVGTSKKTAKGRLDKYYHLAKEQGYRARSAFKLIQLNRKYQFLEKARVLIDLCAAPGGWLQVACKNMPMSHLIIGVDLTPIKPIPGVITLTHDITTDQCRSALRKELKDWKADVVLHDGAPNVGSAWVQDAFGQAELVLMSLKLATDMLTPGGTFVTKVFRSKDYNALMWVFTQLFKKVEATKPASSRSVSAEIFVVCQDYLAPKKIDPKFLDPKCVFQDMDLPIKPLNIFRPDKQIRSRDGYEDGATMLFKAATAEQFILSEDPATFLGTYSLIAFPKENSTCKLIGESSYTTDEILYSCSDLKLLGKREFKDLLKWRLKIKKELDLKSTSEREREALKIQKFNQVIEETPISDTEQLDAMIQSDDRKKRRAKKKVLLKRAKERERMKLGIQKDDSYEHKNEQVMEMHDQELFSLNEVSNRTSIDTFNEMSDEGTQHSDFGGKEDEFLSVFEDSDQEDPLDVQLEGMYARFKESQNSKSAKKSRSRRSTDFSDNSDLEQDDSHNTLSMIEDAQDTMEEEISEENLFPNCSSKQKNNAEHTSLITSLLTNEETRSEQSQRAALLFSRPIFQNFQENVCTKNINNDGDMCKKPLLANVSGIDPPASGKRAKENRLLKTKVKDAKLKKVVKKRNQEYLEEENELDNDSNSGIEFVKADPDPIAFDEAESVFTEEDKKMMMSPEGMTLALALRNQSRKSILDGSFSRYSYAEDRSDLPTWFADDEAIHSKLAVKPTLAAYNVLNEKAVSAVSGSKKNHRGPSKKEMEAKYRKKAKAIKRLEAMKSKTGVIIDNEELSEAQKSASIQKILRSASRKSDKIRKKTIVVARGLNRGLQSRPKGIKGRYKMVDPRMKKETRAKKRSQKQTQKKRR